MVVEDFGTVSPILGFGLMELSDGKSDSLGTVYEPLEIQVERTTPGCHPKSLIELCIDRLSASGCRTVFRELHRLPESVIDRLLLQLADDNSLTDNVAIRCLTKERTHLTWDGCTMLRKSIFFQVPRNCPNLVHLSLQRCKQIGNGIVRDILVNCRYLKILRLDGCRNISDAAFTTRPFDIFHGLVGLRELGLSKCPQITSATLQTIVKNCPQLEELYLSQNRQFDDASVTDIIESCRMLRVLDLGQCARLTQALFFALGELSPINCPNSSTDNRGQSLSNGHITNTTMESQSSDKSSETPTRCVVPELSLVSLVWAHLSTSPRHLHYLAIIAPRLQHIDLRWTRGVTDESLRFFLLRESPISSSLLPSTSETLLPTKKTILPNDLRLPNLQSICLRGCAEISNNSIRILALYQNLKHVDFSWCFNTTPSFILDQFSNHIVQYLNISFCCPIDKSTPIPFPNLHLPNQPISFDPAVSNNKVQVINSETPKSSTTRLIKDSVYRHSSVECRHTKRQKMNTVNIEQSASLQSTCDRISSNDIISPLLMNQHLNYIDSQADQLIKLPQSDISHQETTFVTNLPSCPNFDISEPVDPQYLKFFANGKFSSDSTQHPFNNNHQQTSLNFTNFLLSSHSSSLMNHISHSCNQLSSSFLQNSATSKLSSLADTFAIPRSIRFSRSLSHLKLDGLSDLIDVPFFKSLSAHSYLVSLSLRLPSSPPVGTDLSYNSSSENSTLVPWDTDVAVPASTSFYSSSDFSTDEDFSPILPSKILSSQENRLFTSLAKLGHSCPILQKLRLDLSDLLYSSQEIFLRKYLPHFGSITKLTLRLATNKNVEHYDSVPIFFYLLRHRDGQLACRLHKLLLYNCDSIMKPSLLRVRYFSHHRNFDSLTFQASQELGGSSAFLKQRLARLKSLVLSNCFDLDDDDVFLVSQYLSAVQNVCFLNCAKLTENSYKHIINHCKAIQTVHITSATFRKRMILHACSLRVTGANNVTWTTTRSINWCFTMPDRIKEWSVPIVDADVSSLPPRNIPFDTTQYLVRTPSFSDNDGFNTLSPRGGTPWFRGRLDVIQGRTSQNENGFKMVREKCATAVELMRDNFNQMIQCRDQADSLLDKSVALNQTTDQFNSQAHALENHNRLQQWIIPGVSFILIIVLMTILSFLNRFVFWFLIVCIILLFCSGLYFHVQKRHRQFNVSMPSEVAMAVI